MAKAVLTTALVAAGLTAAAFVFNPSPAQHRDRIKAAMAERHPVASALGAGLLAAYTTTYHPLGVASYTTANGQLVSIGAFGVVFVLAT